MGVLQVADADFAADQVNELAGAESVRQAARLRNAGCGYSALPRRIRPPPHASSLRHISRGTSYDGDNVATIVVAVVYPFIRRPCVRKSSHRVVAISCSEIESGCCRSDKTIIAIILVDCLCFGAINLNKA